MTNLQVLRHINNIKEVALRSPLLHKHSSVAIKHGKIISRPEINDFKPYTFGCFSGTRHAEISCISSILGKYQYYILPEYCKKRNQR